MGGVTLDPLHANRLTPGRNIYDRLIIAVADHVISGDHQSRAEGKARAAVFPPTSTRPRQPAIAMPW